MSSLRIVKGGVCSAKGFRAAGVAAEIKYKGRNDVALIVADEPCAAAAVFTTNKVAAAPVLYDREIVKGGKVQAILANSGCANACTGKMGLRDAELSALATAGELGISPKHVLVASTGVIGRPLPMDRLLAGMKQAAKKLGRTPAHGLAAEKAVMTTDTKPKQACATVKIGGRTVTVGGMSKGSGMIEPNMATMLGFITTDANITAAMLKRALFLAINRSFNRLVVDGDESTNDSVFLLASGKAGNKAITKAGKDFDAFREALEAVCISLARQMATDGEGATKFVTVTVKGAKSEADAFYADWLADPTEDHFAQLCTANSDDTHTNANGGLYTDVSMGYLDEGLEAWIFDEARQPGDTDIIYCSNTSYTGYHIVYYVGEGERYDRTIARSLMETDWSENWRASNEAAYPISTGFGFGFVKKK